MAATAAASSQPAHYLAKHRAAALTLAAALLAAAAIVPLVQWLFGLLMTTSALIGLGAGLQEAVFTLLLSGGLLAVAAIGLTLAHGWERLAGPAPLVMAGSGFGLGLAGLAASAALAALALTIAHPARLPGSGTILSLFAGTLLILFQASVEEVYFRGWLQPVLSRAWGNFPGLFITAAAFAVLHLLGGDRTPLTLLNLLLGGLLFGLLAQRSGGIVLPAAAHFAWNWAEAVGLGLSPNPGVGNFGAIVDLDLIGSRNWGGSAEGLNASLGMSFVLVALLLPVIAWRRPGSAWQRPLSSTAPPG